MTISFEKAKNILKTLPVGYYLGRHLDVTLSEESPASFYDMINDEIVVSLSNINEAAKLTPELNNKDVEKLVRCLLYHEISHAILTPKSLMIRANKLKTNYPTKYGELPNIINIFEDERIETLLKSYYLDVDFKGFVKTLNHWAGSCYKDAKGLFYEIVRFRTGPEEFVNAVKALIDRYKDMSALSNHYLMSNYLDDVWNLYLSVREYLKEHSTESKPESKPVTKSSSFGEGMSDESEEKTESESESKTSDVVGQPGHGSPDLSDTEIKEIKKLIDTVLTKASKKYSSPNLEKIITEFVNTKKVRNAGGAVNAYSGIIDPRSCARKDYKWWLKNNSMGSVNKFDKVVLNLFVDVSGSFSPSEDKINSIIKELARCNNKYKDFEFNLITMGMKNVYQDHNNLEVKCTSGNNLDSTIFEPFRQVQTPNRTIYNIVVFDGDAFSDCCPIDYSTMKVFNQPYTTIISDNENRVAIEKYAPLSHKIIVGCYYAKELENNIIKTLKQFCK